jgi:hypothetical protein
MARTPVAAPQQSVPAPEMTLLRGIDLMPGPASRPALSTLASLAAHVPQSAAAARPEEAGFAAFPLIDALDLPGGGMASRPSRPTVPAALEPVPNAEPPEPEVVALPEPATAVEPPKPVVLRAADVAVPLSKLFQLLAAGPAASAEAFAALHLPAPQPTA